MKISLNSPLITNKISLLFLKKGIILEKDDESLELYELEINTKPLVLKWKHLANENKLINCTFSKFLKR